MSECYVGEIRLFAFPRIPSGWLACDGGMCSISDYEVLYTLIGTTYGGDGVQSFAVPDLRGRVPVHEGSGPGLSTYVLGQMAGTEEVTLTSGNLPRHNHAFLATTAAATSEAPGQDLLPGATSNLLYVGDRTGATAAILSPVAIGATGNSVPHDNLMPMLTLSYCIAFAGIYPSQS